VFESKSRQCNFAKSSSLLSAIIWNHGERIVRYGCAMVMAGYYTSINGGLGILLVGAAGLSALMLWAWEPWKRKGR
jgi:hypothetical protein